MLNKKNVKITKSEMSIDNLREKIELNNYHIKAKDLRKMLNMNMKDIDDIITSIDNVPISKYRKNGLGLNETYYVFPIELLISNFILTKSISK